MARIRGVVMGSQVNPQSHEHLVGIPLTKTSTFKLKSTKRENRGSTVK